MRFSELDFTAFVLIERCPGRPDAGHEWSLRIVDMGGWLTSTREAYCPHCGLGYQEAVDEGRDMVARRRRPAPSPGRVAQLLISQLPTPKPAGDR